MIYIHVMPIHCFAVPSNDELDEDIDCDKLLDSGL